MTDQPDPRPDPRARFARLVLEADAAFPYPFGQQHRPPGEFLIGRAA
jgi:hypothetical protein